MSHNISNICILPRMPYIIAKERPSRCCNPDLPLNEMVVYGKYLYRKYDMSFLDHR